MSVGYARPGRGAPGCAGRGIVKGRIVHCLDQRRVEQVKRLGSKRDMEALFEGELFLQPEVDVVKVGENEATGGQPSDAFDIRATRAGDSITSHVAIERCVHEVDGG